MHTGNGLENRQSYIISDYKKLYFDLCEKTFYQILQRNEQQYYQLHYQNVDMQIWKLNHDSITHLRLIYPHTVQVTTRWVSCKVVAMLSWHLYSKKNEIGQAHRAIDPITHIHKNNYSKSEEAEHCSNSQCLQYSIRHY